MLDERRKFSTQKVRLMPLKLRPTGLGSGIDKDRPDYTVVAVGGLVLSFALEK